MPFRYLKDPLFLCCFAVYWINRLAESFGYGTSLTASYLNDVILVPFFLPMMLRVLRWLGVRSHDRVPGLVEIIIPVSVWAMIFEVALPSLNGWRTVTVADPNDVVCYFFGGLISHRIWTWYYMQPVERAGSTEATASR